MNKVRSRTTNIRPILIAVLFFIVLSVAAVSYTHFKENQWEMNVRSTLLNTLIGKKSRLEKALYSRIFYTRGVAAYVALKPSITTEEYFSLAKEYIQKDTVISTMSLSRNCIISAIYPLKGHEVALGLNLLEHPERKAIVEKTIETRQPFIAGPVELVEGGQAFISYTPIFEKIPYDKTRFWGVTDIVINKQRLLLEAGFQPSDKDYRYALRGTDGSGSNGPVFWGDSTVFHKNPVTIAINLPIGNWVLAATPNNSHPNANPERVILIILLTSSFVISILLGLFTRALFKIRQNELELKTIFTSMDNLIVEFDSHGRCLKIAPTSTDILSKPKASYIGKTVAELFEEEPAASIMHAIAQCLSTKKIQVIDLMIVMDGKTRWFTSRFNYKNEHTVLCNTYDITEKKKDEQTILETSGRLYELNRMKDQFFSILAHDLRNPVGNQKQIIDMVLRDDLNLSEKEKSDLFHGLQESASGLYNLVEDLLEWSRAQSEDQRLQKRPFVVKALCTGILSTFKANILLKNIQLKLEIPDDLNVVSDANIVGLVLRNLISNAIKFSHSGGEIRISTENIRIEERDYIRINVFDGGIGIQPDKLETLMQSNVHSSTDGTLQEKGSGLGLSLCLEMAPRIGARLSVFSRPGLGSTFSFDIPMV